MTRPMWRSSSVRVRRVSVLLWYCAAALLVAGIAGVGIVVGGQNNPSVVNGSVPIAMIIGWAVTQVLPVLFTLGFACAVAPFFLLVVHARRSTGTETEPDTGPSAEP
ncbi:MAG TPA: hypothetical protein VN133_12760 [Humibacter sp.]|nr:hypothetical protein [Humibacter sp.]